MCVCPRTSGDPLEEAHCRNVHDFFTTAVLNLKSEVCLTADFKQILSIKMIRGDL